MDLNIILFCTSRPCGLCFVLIFSNIRAFSLNNKKKFSCPWDLHLATYLWLIFTLYVVAMKMKEALLLSDAVNYWLFLFW